jgi:hypothetical protein
LRNITGILFGPVFESHKPIIRSPEKCLRKSSETRDRPPFSIQTSGIKSYVVKGLEMWLYFPVLTHFIKLLGEQIANSVMPLRHESPFLHARALFMLKRFPHAQWLGRSFIGRLYFIRNESLNYCLLRAKPWSLTGMTFSQQHAHLSLDCITKNSRSGCRDASMLSILDLAVSVLIVRSILFRPSIDCSHDSIPALWPFD